MLNSEHLFISQAKRVKKLFVLWDDGNLPFLRLLSGPSTSSLRLGICHDDENWISIIYDTFIYCDSRASYLLIWILKFYNENKIFVVLLDLRQTARPEPTDEDELCAVIYSSPLQPLCLRCQGSSEQTTKLRLKAHPESSKNKKALKCKYAELFLWLFVPRFVIVFLFLADDAITTKAHFHA